MGQYRSNCSKFVKTCNLTLILFCWCRRNSPKYSKIDQDRPRLPEIAWDSLRKHSSCYLLSVHHCLLILISYSISVAFHLSIIETCYHLQKLVSFRSCSTTRNFLIYYPKGPHRQNKCLVE